MTDPCDKNSIDLSTFVPETAEDVERLRRYLAGRRDLPRVPRPIEPVISPTLPMQQRLNMVQKFVQSFKYNYDSTQYFDISYGRPLCATMHIAMDIIREALPIRCVEGVFLALYLTRTFNTLARLPLSFESVCGGKTWGHIVLAVRDAGSGRWGALGMSRRRGLRCQPLEFHTLADLVDRFLQEYGRALHTVRRVRLGLLVPHDMTSSAPVSWKHTTFDVQAEPTWREAMNAHVRLLLTGAPLPSAGCWEGSASPSRTRSPSVGPRPRQREARGASPARAAASSPALLPASAAIAASVAASVSLHSAPAALSAPAGSPAAAATAAAPSGSAAGALGATLVPPGGAGSSRRSAAASVSPGAIGGAGSRRRGTPSPVRHRSRSRTRTLSSLAH